MNKSFVIPAVFVTVFLSFLVSKAEELDVFHGVKYVSVSGSKLYSGTITLSRISGEFKDVSAKGDVLALIPGDALSCRFKLPDNAFNVKATIDYYVSSDSAVGKIRLNKELFSDDNSLLKKRVQQGLTTTEILLKNVQTQNELNVFAIEGEVCIHQIKIDYDYRMPSCKTDDVTVVLTSPVANTDVLQQNMRFEWKIIGARKNGWVTLKYQKQDNGAWETVPGAELLDCQATQKSGDYCEFFWNNHGLSAIPKIQIEYHDYNSELPKRFSREMRPYVLDNTKSVDAFILLAKLFLEEDKELLKKIVLKRDKITVFTPTEKTSAESNSKMLLNLPQIAAPSLYNQKIQADIIISQLKDFERQRFDKDFKIHPIDQKTIENNVNILGSLEKSVEELKQCVDNRIKLSESQKKSSLVIQSLKKVQSLIVLFQNELMGKERQYISYSVVSPYLCNMDRALYWNKNGKYVTPPQSHYDGCLEMMRFIDQKGLIKGCLGDVQKQYNDLMQNYPSLKDELKQGASVNRK